MPICEISFAKGIIADTEEEKIVERLTTLLLKAEGFENNSMSRSICLIRVFIDENKYTRKQNGNNIWCVIIPVETNNFGVGGNPVTLEMIKQIVSSTK